jgi:hypothetical protein
VGDCFILKDYSFDLTDFVFFLPTECTYSHFQSSPNCPSCNRILSENDFTELVVAEPSAKQSLATFQNIFTKQNSQAQSLSFQDLCANIMRRNDDLRAGTKFLMKQFLLESSKQNARSGQTVKLLNKLKEENTSLKQVQNTQRMKYEQAIETLQQQLHSTQKKMDEKEQQLLQFRRLHGASRAPESPRSGAGGPRRVSGAGMGTPSSFQQPPQPPIQGFMVQKEAQERAKQRVLESPQYRRPIIGGGGGGGGRQHEDKENFRTTNHLSNHSDRCHHQHHRRRYQQHHRHHSGHSTSSIQTPQRPYSGGTVGSGGIRNLTSSSGFAFSGRIQKKIRSSTSSSGGDVSPSQAFVNNSSGGYNIRSPSGENNRGGYARKY